MTSALLTGFALSALRAGFFRKLCSAAAAAPATATAPASDDQASVSLHGTVERLISAGPKYCFFVVRTSVVTPGLERPSTYHHNVKAFGAEALSAASVCKVGGRVQIQGVLNYEKRFRDKPVADDNPYICVIKVSHISAKG